MPLVMVLEFVNCHSVKITLGNEFFFPLSLGLVFLISFVSVSGGDCLYLGMNWVFLLGIVENCSNSTIIINVHRK